MTQAYPLHWPAGRPRANYVHEMTAAIQGHVRTLSDADLSALYEATAEPTQTNCDWAVFQAAGPVRAQCRRELARRLPTQQFGRGTP